uniref:Carbonic anhydrase n=1 Tax=Schistocephalus solidus TaxID=70667 RepID=A0A0X3NK46_SCHSO
MASRTGSNTDYGYGPKNGPHTWCLTAEYAAGRKQSPVNIITQKCEENLEFPILALKPLKSGLQVFKKGKHNFSITFPQEKPACIEGGPLRERYILQQFHFHWGHESKWGSEHHVDGFSYSAEMHLVFLAERYSAESMALKDPEGLCVLGIFLRAGTKENDGFKTLLKAIEKSNTDSEAVLDTPIDIFAILPNLSRYYTYEGSLTTPPCSECVRWIVCADPVEISDTQLGVMRTMHKCDTCETCENFRPPLPLGHRTLIRSFKP